MLKVKGRTVDDVQRDGAPNQARNILRELLEKVHRAGELKTVIDQLERWVEKNHGDHPMFESRERQRYDKGLERGELLGDIARLGADLERVTGQMSGGRAPYPIYGIVASWTMEQGGEECPF